MFVLHLWRFLNWQFSSEAYHEALHSFSLLGKRIAKIENCHRFPVIMSDVHSSNISLTLTKTGNKKGWVTVDWTYDNETFWCRTAVIICHHFFSFYCFPSLFFSWTLENYSFSCVSLFGVSIKPRKTKQTEKKKKQKQKQRRQ